MSMLLKPAPVCHGMDSAASTPLPHLPHLAPCCPSLTTLCPAPAAALKDCMGRTAVHFAASLDHPDCILALAEHDAANPEAAAAAEGTRYAGPAATSCHGHVVLTSTWQASRSTYCRAAATATALSHLPVRHCASKHRARCTAALNSPSSSTHAGMHAPRHQHPSPCSSAHQHHHSCHKCSQAAACAGSSMCRTTRASQRCTLLRGWAARARCLCCCLWTRARACAAAAPAATGYPALLAPPPCTWRP